MTIDLTDPKIPEATTVTMELSPSLESPPPLNKLEDMDLSSMNSMPIHQVLVMTNHFIASNLAFFDRFAHIAEAKLLQLGRSIDVLENSLNLLNVKVESVAWIADQKFEAKEESILQSQTFQASQNSSSQEGYQRLTPNPSPGTGV